MANELPPVPYNAQVTTEKGTVSNIWSSFFRQLLSVVGSTSVIYPISIANGGTGATSRQSAINALTGTQSVGNYLRSDGTNATLTPIQASDIPVLNQNTTGTAGNVTGTVAIANGGTGKTSASAAFNALSPITSTGDLIIGNGANSATRLAIGASGTFLKSNGATGAWSTFATPTVQTFTSTGTTTGYLFTISTSTTCAVGDTYTNNGNTYTVLGALSAQSGQVLFMSGAGAPTASGTLTRATGSGTASITFSVATPLATYTTPANALYLRIRMIGGGGGGGGSGSTAGGTGGTGGGTFFGANLLTANGGTGGGSNVQNGGPGGTASIASGPIGIALTGGYGEAPSPSFQLGSLNFMAMSGIGAASPFGGSGSNANPTIGRSGTAGANNTGAGGGGAAMQVSSGTAFAGAGGGAGGYIDAIINNPSSIYYYTIGSGGTGGTIGTGGTVGSAGGSGLLIVEEHYQ